MDIHAGTMTPIAIASLAALVGLFTLLDARAGGPALVLAGYRDEMQAVMIAVAWLGFLALTAIAVIHRTARSVTKVLAASSPAIYPGRVSENTPKRRLVR